MLALETDGYGTSSNSQTHSAVRTFLIEVPRARDVREMAQCPFSPRVSLFFAVGNRDQAAAGPAPLVALCRSTLREKTPAKFLGTQIPSLFPLPGSLALTAKFINSQGQDAPPAPNLLSPSRQTSSFLTPPSGLPLCSTLPCLRRAQRLLDVPPSVESPGSVEPVRNDRQCQCVRYFCQEVPPFQCHILSNHTPRQSSCLASWLFLVPSQRQAWACSVIRVLTSHSR